MVVLNWFNHTDFYLFITSFLNYIKIYLILFVDTDRCANFKHSSFHIDTQHDRITLPESLNLLQNAREHRLFSLFLSAFLFDTFDMLGEHLCQMIDNVCCEYFDTVLFSIFLSICENFHIEDEKTCVLLFSSLGDLRQQRFHCSNHVFFGDWANWEIRHGNFLRF